MGSLSIKFSITSAFNHVIRNHLDWRYKIIVFNRQNVRPDLTSPESFNKHVSDSIFVLFRVSENEENFDFLFRLAAATLKTLIAHLTSTLQHILKVSARKQKVLRYFRKIAKTEIAIPSRLAQNCHPLSKGRPHVKKILLFWILSKLPPPPPPQDLDNLYNFFIYFTAA